MFIFAAIFKIADLDFWWHLKTGQILWQQKQIPRTEIYSFTAAGRPYIDHEWLFQLIQYALYHNGGATAVIVVKALLFSAIYILIARYLLQQNTDYLSAGLFLLLSICGARSRFIERPEMFTAFFLVSTYLLIDGYLKSGKAGRLWLILPIILVWSNIHAAVILGLIVEIVFLIALLFERFLKRSGYPNYYPASNSSLIMLAILFVASLALTGLNPFGYHVLKVPFELTSIIDSGLLNNQEWQQPSPFAMPFYYICLVSAFVFIAINFRRLHIANFLLTAFFAYISLKYVRNVGLFCILMPLMISPYLAAFSEKAKNYQTVMVPAIAILTFVLFTTSPFEFGTGQASYFPDKIVRFVKERNLQGNMLNSYAFGGYLIWNLYPERKIFIDGRNEVYLPLLKKLVASRGDSRNWKKLLSDYQIEYALLNYIDQLEELKIMQKNNQFVTTYAPFSSTHFPRSAWALVYFDDGGMILVKRKGANQNLLSSEYTSVFPEGRMYQQVLAMSGKISPQKAIQELERKLKEDPNCQRARYLLAVLQKGL